MVQPAPTREQLASLLALYAESGLDFPIEGNAPDRFAQRAEQEAVVESARPGSVLSVSAVQNQTANTQAPATAPQNAAAPISDTQAVAEATRLAAQVNDLSALADAVRAFDGCALKRSARHTIFEGGRRGAPLMLILQAPTRDDDRAGSAFCGEAGRLLAAMLEAIGLDRDKDTYAGYCVAWHPPGDQPPTPRHMAIYRPFLDRQIALSAPKCIVTMVGSGAVKHLFGSDSNLLSMRGTSASLAGTPALATFSPQFLLNEPSQKRNAWLDLLSLQAQLGGVN